MRSCPACASASAEATGSTNGFDLVRCNRCATLFTASLPRTEAEAQEYSSYYDHGNLEVPAFVEQQLGRLVGSLEPYRQRNRWLDIGCGAGSLLRVATSHGWTAIGTEVAAEAVDSVRSQGFDVRLGELETLGLEPRSFDVVSALEVLEHVTDPGALVSATFDLIRPGGVFYLTTPHSCGISARILRISWSVISPPEHLQLFSVRGLMSMLTQAGLEVRQVHTHAVNPRELLAGLRRGDGAPRIDRVETSYQLNEVLSTRRSGRLAKATVNRALNTLRLGDSLKVRARRPGRLPPLP